MENNFLLESQGACHDAESKIMMYFTVNTAFVKLLQQPRLTPKYPLLLNQTTYEQTLPISLQVDPDLLKTPRL